MEEFEYKVHYKKGKENTVADALSRVEINTKETIEDPSDTDLSSVTPNVNEDPELQDLEDEDDRQDAEDSGQTIHTSVENPVFTMPISDKPINQFVNRIVFKLGNQYNVTYRRPFSKHHYNVTIRKGNEVENLVKIMQEHVDPKLPYGIYFTDEQLEAKFLKVTQDLFDNNVKFVTSNILARDLENQKEQTNKINEYHSLNHNGVVETYNHFKTRYYWPDMRTRINQVINECETCLINK